MVWLIGWHSNFVFGISKVCLDVNCLEYFLMSSLMNLQSDTGIGLGPSHPHPCETHSSTHLIPALICI
jgi:hypothetical protein